MDLGINNASKSILGNGVNDFSTNGYLINDKGEINIHYLGFIYVEGLTLNELTKKLERDLIPYLREPIVTIEILNKKITIIGQVITPRIMSIKNDQISVFDVIASCGNLKDDADTKDVIIIRDSGSSKIVKHLNLQNHLFLSSPWFYVKSDDIVYFKKDTNKFDKDIRKRELQTVVSLATSIFSLGILVLNLIKK
jgi:polysaccharide export outer membrane protein